MIGSLGHHNGFPVIILDSTPAQFDDLVDGHQCGGSGKRVDR
jgi:hypothetical protein